MQVKNMSDYSSAEVVKFFKYLETNYNDIQFITMKYLTMSNDNIHKIKVLNEQARWHHKMLSRIIISRLIIN